MNNQLFLFFLFIYVFTYSQKQQKVITGKIFLDGESIADVHIVNKNSNLGTNSNNIGLFEIPVVIGDTLAFSHINLKDKIIAITKEVFETEILKINLDSKTYQLEEITIGKPKSIFYVDPDIMPAPNVNAKTLKLPYANTHSKKDYKILKFKSGGVVNLDNFINLLNGNTKRRKELLKITSEDKILNKIRKHYTDDFFITDLSIKKEDINPFLNYCFKKNIINHYNRNNLLELTTILIEESRSFPQFKIELSQIKNE